MSFKKEFKSILILLIIILLAILLLYAPLMAMEYFDSNGNNWIYYFIIYFLIAFTINWLFGKFPNKTFRFLNLILWLPLSIISNLFQFAIPALALFYHFFLFVLFSFVIPLVLLKLNKHYGYVYLMEPTELFIILTFATCISITLYRQILSLVYRIGPFRVKSSKKMKKFKLEELTEYVFNKENIRFAIYISYFIYLVIFSFSFLQDSSIFEIQQKDRAILQSFLCFLAYERLLLNSKSFVLLPSVLLKKAITWIVLDKNENNKQP